MSRRLLTTAVLVMIVSAAAVGVTLGAAGDDEIDIRSAMPADVSLDTDSAAIRTPSAPDPRGGAPWSTVEYRTKDGRSCAKPGRRVRDTVGSLGDRNDVAGSSLKEGGSCVDVAGLPQDRPLAWHISGDEHDPRTGERDPISYVWGLARPGVTSVTISSNAGTKTVPVTAGHAFIAVFRGRVALGRVTFEALLSDKTSRAIVVDLASGTDLRDQLENPPTEQDALRSRGARQP